VVVGEPEPETSTPRQGFLRFLKERLTKTREGLLLKIDRLLSSRQVIDADLFEELEEVLISSDLGVQTTMHHAGTSPVGGGAAPRQPHRDPSPFEAEPLNTCMSALRNCALK
jgi:hypothetical protein